MPTLSTPRQYLALSTIIGLFSHATVIRLSIGIEPWYFVMAANFLLMIWLGAFHVPRGVVWLAAILVLSGVIGVSQGTDNFKLVGKQLAGILTSALYFSCFYRAFDKDVARCFSWYIRAAYYVAWIGILRGIVECAIYGFLPRLQSILTEPSIFAIVTLPAMYYCVDRYRVERTLGKEALVLLIALVLSRSSVGFLGLLFASFLLLAGTRKGFVLALTGVAALGVAFYQSSNDFRKRLDDTLQATENSDVTDANLSTFALVSNAFITAQVLLEHPVTGNGLGSHLLSHERFISDVPGVHVFENMMLQGNKTMDELNAADANSLLLRILSELGLAGLMLTALYIVRFRKAEKGESMAIRNAILVYFFVKLLRAGHYFSPEQFFFVVGYCFNSRIKLKKDYRETCLVTT